ncbi:hypothetical protein FSP39_015681 [Pinctada imbricata]|uniref:Prospero domain-containing protein n=1 Tax=Pinctada imbricata TaxID=66713 RepID=A0AA88XWV9_PINIB|nr:hypothetical protein FSP39_015681 [Pinctada imbricata]
MTSLVDNHSSLDYGTSMSYPNHRDICSLNIHTNNHINYKLKISDENIEVNEKDNDVDSGCNDSVTSPSKSEENSENTKMEQTEESEKVKMTNTEAPHLLRGILQNKDKLVGENNNISAEQTTVENGSITSKAERHLMKNIISTYDEDDDDDDDNSFSGDITGESDYESSGEQLNADDGDDNADSTEDSKEAKRARVENLLSTMRPDSRNSTDQNEVNTQEVRRQKRKQYQPIQHDPNWPEHSGPKYSRFDEKMVLQEELVRLQQQLHFMQKRYTELQEEKLDEGKASNRESTSEKSILEIPKYKDYRNTTNSENKTKPVTEKQEISHQNPSLNKLCLSEKNKSTVIKPHIFGTPLQKLDLENLTNSIKSGLSGMLNDAVDNIVGKFLEERTKQEKEQEKQRKELEEAAREMKQQKQEKFEKPREHDIFMPPRISPMHPDMFRHDHIGNMARILEKASAFETPRLPPELHRAPPHPLPFPLSFPYFPHQMLHPPLYSCAQSSLPEPEQTEALPLVVNNGGGGTPKKKRTKVTDTRLSPRAARALLGHEPIHLNSAGDLERSIPSSFPSLIPPVLPTSVAIPNPSLQESNIMNFYREHTPFSDVSRTHSPLHGEHLSPSSTNSPSDSIGHMMKPEFLDTGSDSFDCHNMPLISFFDKTNQSNCPAHTSTLTPMHLRKAKLMFFYVREFYYIQMEKYARQAIAEGCKHPDDLVVTTESELYRVLNLHYNRNNQIEVPDNFRLVVQATLREFYKAIVACKDTEPSWKKSIYKVIARMDDTLPEYFKSPNWMDQLGDV